MYRLPAGRVARSAALLALTLAAASLAGASPQRQQAAPPAHAVAMDATAFTPAMLRVKVGERIVWTNSDPFPHTVTSRAGGFDSKSIRPGRSWTYRAVRKGTFPYICTLHPTMKGELIVE